MSSDNYLAGTTEVAAGTKTYHVRVAGHLDDHWSDWLGGHRLVRDDDATTDLILESVDQAELHGVLSSIRDLGVELLLLRPLEQEFHRDASQRPVLDRTLHTKRLTLRRASADDADATWAYRRLHSVNEWLSGVPGTLTEYRGLFTTPARLSTTVIVELTPTRDADHVRPPVVIGDLMLRLDDAWAQNEVADQAKEKQAEVGWALDPTYTGAGYATEAVRELLRYCFDELEIHRVVANCFLDHTASWRLMERLAMRRETHAIGESLHRSGRWLDTVGYALLEDEWMPSGA